MQITRESDANHSVQAYNDHSIQINGQIYTKSLILSADALMTDWAVTDPGQITIESLSLLLASNPKIILIGHQSGQTLALSVLEKLQALHVSCEILNLPAALRTWNVLLSEEREVVLGVIFS